MISESSENQNPTRNNFFDFQKNSIPRQKVHHIHKTLQLNENRFLLQRVKRVKANAWSLSANEGEMSKKEGEKLALAIKAAPKIQKLAISCNGGFYGDGITDKGLKKIRERLGKVTSLQTIRFSFSKLYRVTEKGLLNIAKTLKRLKSLKHVELDFKQCSTITNVGVYNLGKALGTLKSLKTQSLEIVS